MSFFLSSFNGQGARLVAVFAQFSRPKIDSMDIIRPGLKSRRKKIVELAEISEGDLNGVSNSITDDFVNVTAEYADRAPTNRSGNSTISPYPEGYVNAKTVDQFHQIVRNNTDFSDRQVMEIGNSALRNAGAYINAVYPLAGGAELYGNFGFNSIARLYCIKASS